MGRATHPQTQREGIQTPTATTTARGEDQRNAQRRYHIQTVLLGMGLILFTLSCFVIHFHPRPYSIDLTAAHAVHVQALQPQLPEWLAFILVLPSIVNNPVPSALEFMG
jgi:hypothetical protein